MNTTTPTVRSFLDTPATMQYCGEDAYFTGPQHNRHMSNNSRDHSEVLSHMAHPKTEQMRIVDFKGK